MNKTPSEAKQLIADIIASVGQKPDNVEVVVCPPFVALDAAVKAAKGSFIKVGAQNLHFEAKGAYTGEIAADMLNDLGVDYVIIGHSERRQYFAETDETVNLKIKAFGEICERIKKMKLKEGSVVTIFGDYDEERWTDKESKEKRSSPVINLDDIQYSYSGSGQKKGQNGGADGTGQGTQQDYPTGQSQPSSYPATGQSQPPAAPPASSGAMPQGFTGYESFSGGNNPYFPG